MYFSKGNNGNTLSFPLTQEGIDSLVKSKFASPMVGDNHGLKDLVKGNEEELLEEVMRVRADVARGVFPHWFMEKNYPSEWGSYEPVMPQPLVNEGLSFDDPDGCANVVHMDSPIDMPVAVMKWLLSKGYKPDGSNPDCIDFIEYIPETIRKLSQAAERNLKKAFEAKYYFGTPRPEELCGYNMTAYPEGCPTHPSQPAGHGAAAGAVSVLIKRFNVEDEADIKVIRDTAYLWSQFRTLAGVHYSVDNIQGLRISGLL